MKSMMQMVARKGTPPAMTNGERTAVYKEAFSEALSICDEEDRKRLNHILSEFDANLTRVRNMGKVGAQELLGALGIWMQQFPESVLLRMIHERKNRKWQ